MRHRCWQINSRHCCALCRFLRAEMARQLAFAWKEQLPRCMMTALLTNTEGRLKGVHPSGGSALTNDSGADAVELTSGAIDGPKLACMTVYACPSAPPPCANPCCMRIVIPYPDTSMSRGTCVMFLKLRLCGALLCLQALHSSMS